MMLSRVHQELFVDNFTSQPRIYVLQWVPPFCLVSTSTVSPDATRVGSNPVFGTTDHKPTVKSAVHPSEVGQ